jgi:hypothetical protein
VFVGVYLRVQRGFAKLRNIQNRLRERDAKRFEQILHRLGRLISLKQYVRESMNFGGLYTSEYGSKLRPRLVTGEFGNPLDKQRHHVDFDMGFDTT